MALMIKKILFILNDSDSNIYVCKIYVCCKNIKKYKPDFSKLKKKSIKRLWEVQT